MNIVELIRSKDDRKRTVSSGRLYAFPVPQLEPGMAVSLRRIFQQDRFVEALSYPENPEPLHEAAFREIAQRIFLRGESVAVDQGARALQVSELDTLVCSGLLQENNGWVQSYFKVQSYQGLILLSDFPYNLQAPDFVLPIGPAGHYLANLTIRTQVSSALDLGCGCGIQSLLAARHCTRVTATDINPRALALTRLNAELNGIANIEVLQGSTFEPVKGRRFDLILANLPYVISPEIQLIYRNTDQPGDASIRRLLREIPAYLSEGGYAHVLVNWVHEKEEPWAQPLRAAMEGNGADAWLIYNGSKSAQAYAEMWIEGETKKDAGAFARMKKSWMKWYRLHGIERIALGAVILRRCTSGSNWFCAAPVNRSLENPASEQLQQLFAAQDTLSTLGHPEDLFTKTLIPWRVEKVMDSGGKKVCVRPSSGILLQAEVGVLSAKVLEYLSTGISLQAALDRTAHEQGILPEGASAAVLKDIRLLVNLGMVIPG